MSTGVTILCMIFAHILDDFTLQKAGMLGVMKQKNWWKTNAPESAYRFDYICALVIHSVSWSFMILLPILIKEHGNPSFVYYFAFGINAIIHGIVDDLKANRKKLNLIEDQWIHLLQIVVTGMCLA